MVNNAQLRPTVNKNYFIETRHRVSQTKHMGIIKQLFWVSYLLLLIKLSAIITGNFNI